MRKLVISALLLVLLGLSDSFVIVHEGERGLLLRFGKVMRAVDESAIIKMPGLHVKLPKIDVIKRLDARIQTLNVKTDEFMTAEKKDLVVDLYVKWRIKDFVKFYTSTGSGSQAAAESLLSAKISDRIRSEIGVRTIKDIVSGSRGELMEDAKNALGSEKDGTAGYGMEVLDVRIKQINLPQEVSKSIYERMCAERQAVAVEHRSQGAEQSTMLHADADRRATVIKAEAERKARILQGEGDATAARLFTEAFAEHPEFYGFVRTLQAYEKSFSAQDVLVLKPDSQFLSYLKNDHPKEK